MKTVLTKFHHMENENESSRYTCDEWEIPESGTEIWCTGWKRGQTIKPYGDGMHVVVGTSVYHNDELMGILENWVKEGHTWGIENVKMKRRQKVNGYWEYQMTNREWILEYPEKLEHVLDDFLYFGRSLSSMEVSDDGTTKVIIKWIDERHTASSYDDLLRKLFVNYK